MRTDLTEQEWAQLTAYRSTCLTEALDGKWDLDEFRSAAAEVYATIGHDAPAVVVAPGPVFALGWAAILRGSSLCSSLYSSLDSSLYSSLDPSLRSSLRSSLYSSLGSSLYSSLYSSLDSSLRSSLYSSLDSSLDSSLGSSLRSYLGSSLYSSLGSAHWCWWQYSWLSHWLFVATLDGVTLPADDTMALTRAYRTFCVPVLTIPLEGVVIVCGQHSALSRNAQGDLHCTDGPAWAWPDGTTIYALDGIRVPEWVITQPDAHRILKDLDNTEQRRVAFAHMGWDRVVKDLGLTPIDQHPDPHVGTLYDLPEEAAPGPARLLVATNASPHHDGTWQTYGLLCAPTARTAEEAQASLAGLDLADWRSLDGAS